MSSPQNSLHPHTHTPFDNASMRLSRLFLFLAALLAPLALLGTTWLYLYPIFHNCTFPVPPPTHASRTAPFRLLALGDPQLEGDSSLPDPNAPVFPSLRWVLQDLQYAHDIKTRVNIVRDAAEGVVKDAGKWLEGKRKAVDLWGNDWYLAHIVRSTRWWSEPTHVAVLGDLLGSQWITDGEFEKRAGRYWGVVMRGLERVPGEVYGVEKEEGKSEGDEVVEAEEKVKNTEEGQDAEAAVEEADGESGGNLARAIAEAMEDAVNKKEEEEGRQDEGGAQGEESSGESSLRKPTWGGTTEVLGAEPAWANRVINIAGNHDVGYAGDLDESRITRFEKAFGSVNWDIWFTLPSTNTDDASPEEDTSDTPPALRIVVLNSMNIDTPAWSYEMQTETYSFMNHIITTARPVEDKTHATILLTHIPLEKESGICVDSPYFDYFGDGQGVKEQNMLSDHSSETILQGVFGMSENKWAAGSGLGRKGIVLNGHDHEGCDVVHFIRQDGAPECAIEDIRSEDAHWPAPTSTTESSESATGTMEALSSDQTSSANETNPLINTDEFATSPLDNPEHEPDPEPQSEPEPERKWRAYPFPHRTYSITHSRHANTSICTHIPSSPHIREITLRSMMGDFSGHAGFLSAWFDSRIGEKGQWVFEFNSCGVGVQHWWWGVHSVDFALVVISVLGLVCRMLESKEVRAGQGMDGTDANGGVNEDNGKMKKW
ncbi:hypothetical protein FB567DRAFT_541959 [Paraphoma chrysanthemicola]|uniref:Calcineurin-like phosphoesterase domain-containing protein n=1 Tax=Paraphoma chrysanthemicola TaxID=798071 RepID=A0A8K0QTC4_9PLEO|nr:hypothetical protein FB567DRAFT_541959 [Paraphoma chrysanthemicola]